MNNLFKCLAEFFSPQSSEPVGLCSFEHTSERKKNVRIKQEPKREMRLSELME